MQFLLHGLFRLFNHTVLIGLAVYLILGAVFIWQIHQYPSIEEIGAAHGVVVLTGGEERVDMGFRVLEKGLARRMLISGVHRDVKLHELMVLHSAPRHLAEQVELGFGAMDTAGNAQETAKWVAAHHLNSVIVVTSNYHMKRAILHLRSALPEDIILKPLSVTPSLLQRDKWYSYPQGWVFLFLAYNKYLLTWPEILLWRYRM